MYYSCIDTPLAPQVVSTNRPCILQLYTSVFHQIRESWHWPTFGYCFFEYDSHRDAEDALKEMNGSKSADGK